MPHDVELGYKVTESPEQPSTLSLTRVQCGHCNDFDCIETRWWCTWDEATQKWVADNPDEDNCGYYCKNCSEYYDGEDFDEVKI